jgi:spoIIIJ-associated protein
MKGAELMKQVFTAKSIDEAKAMAAAEFGVEESKLAFNVIEEPKKGLFGKVKGDAKVEAEYEPTKAEIAANYIKSILRNMELDTSLTVTENEEGALIDITGDTSGTIIGRRGETLDAIQYLASMAANRNDKEYYRISVDSCGYREKRKAILEDLAAKIAKNVIRTGRTSSLEPMNPYERRIIHSAVANIEGVTSKSIGEEPYRKVVISSTNPKPRRENRDNKGGYGKGGYKGNRGGRRGDSSSRASLDNMMKTSFEKEYKKPKPEDDLISGDLYGKIDI